MQLVIFNKPLISQNLNSKTLKIIYKAIQVRSKRSAFITLFQADMKSFKNLF